MRRLPEEHHREQQQRAQAQRPGHRGPADQHRQRAADPAPHRVLRRGPLEPQRVDEVVVGDRGGGEAGGQPVGERGHQGQRDAGQDQPENERGARRDGVRGQRAARGTPHHLVDVAVEVAVDGIGRTGGERAAEQYHQGQHQRGEPVLRQEHRGDGGDQEQLDDARLGQRDVRADHAAGPGPLRGRHESGHRNRPGYRRRADVDGPVSDHGHALYPFVQHLPRDSLRVDLRQPATTRPGASHREILR